MTRVLVVHHDVDLSDQEVDALRRRGYDARQCMGPIGINCPVLSGHTCELAAGADVLVYDAFMTGEPEGARRLVERMRELHPDVPIVLVTNSFEPEWVATAGEHRVTPLVGHPTGDRLATAIEAAIALTKAPPGGACLIPLRSTAPPGRGMSRRPASAFALGAFAPRLPGDACSVRRRKAGRLPVPAACARRAGTRPGRRSTAERGWHR